jgi:hypothetical protein
LNELLLMTLEDAKSIASVYTVTDSAAIAEPSRKHQIEGSVKDLLQLHSWATCSLIPQIH